MDIETVLREYERTIVGLPNVTGVGIGKKDGKESIVVFVTEKIPETKLDKWAIIPKKIGTFATDVHRERRKNVRERQGPRDVAGIDPDFPTEILSRMQLFLQRVTPNCRLGTHELLICVT
jgi:hypothetical protein